MTYITYRHTFRGVVLLDYGERMRAEPGFTGAVLVPS